jgi:DNA polymerase III epsilon subunit-like protein
MTEKKKTVQQPQQFGLCIDWETSGAKFGADSSKSFQGISFGAIVFRTDDFSPVAKLYRLVKFDAAKGAYGQPAEWTDFAQGIHGITREHLEENGLSQEDAAIELVEMIVKYFGPGGKVMFLGHNPWFDIRFTNQLLHSINFMLTDEPDEERVTKPNFTFIDLHHVVLDTSALGYITMGLYKSDLLFDKLGFAERGAHNALTDAEQTLETCEAVRMLVTLGREAAGL